jgi:hypothetical protein
METNPYVVKSEVKMENELESALPLKPGCEFSKFQGGNKEEKR